MIGSRLLALGAKELQQLRRDRLTAAMMFALPIVQLLLFGWAINTDVRHIPLVVYDQDHSAAARELERRLVSTGFYDYVGHVETYDEISHAMRTNTARAALVIPPGYASRLTRGERASAQLVVDGADPQTVGSATNTAAGLAGVLSLEMANAQRGASGGAGSATTTAGVQLEPTIWFNPELRTAVYVVPGLTGVILTMTMVMLTAMAIARERERGTLELLVVSPVTRLELIVGKIVPYIGIGYVQMTVVFTLGALVFGVPVVGSIVLLYALALVFIAANLAIGLFFSTIAQTQQQAMQMSFFFLLPNILLSGFMFPFEAMPVPAQWLSQVLPLTHYLRIVRGIVLKGAVFHEVATELWWLTGILCALVLLAAARFKKQVA